MRLLLLLLTKWLLGSKTYVYNSTQKLTSCEQQQQLLLLYYYTYNNN